MTLIVLKATGIAPVNQRLHLLGSVDDFHVPSAIKVTLRAPARQPSITVKVWMHR